jgi:hypothetical protein
VFTASGSFHKSVLNLKHRPLKAYFKVQQSLSKCSQSTISVLLKLFNSVVKPILLYGSEVWGDFLKPRSHCPDFCPNCHGYSGPNYATVHHELCIIGTNRFKSAVKCSDFCPEWPRFYTSGWLLNSRDDTLLQSWWFLIILDSSWNLPTVLDMLKTIGSRADFVQSGGILEVFLASLDAIVNSRRGIVDTFGIFGAKRSNSGDSCVKNDQELVRHHYDK